MEIKKDTKVLALVIAICAVLQIAIAPNIKIGNATPNLLLVAVVCSAVLKGSKVGCITGFVSGLLFDLLGVGPLGGMVAVFTIVGYVVGVFARDLLLESWPMTVVLLALCALFSELIYAILLSIVGANPSFLKSLYLCVLPATLYDAVFACLCYSLVKKYLNPVGTLMKNENRLR